MKFRKKPVVIDAIQYDGTKEGIILCGLEETITEIGVRTLNGFAKIEKGEWIITGVKGERYPCKPDIFEMTYEKENDD